MGGTGDMRGGTTRLLYFQSAAFSIPRRAQILRDGALLDAGAGRVQELTMDISGALRRDQDNAAEQPTPEDANIDSILHQYESNTRHHAE